MRVFFNNILLISILLLIAFTGSIKAQVSCDITLEYNNNESYPPLLDTVCIDGSFALKVQNQDNCKYLWKKENSQDTLSDMYFLTYSITNPTTFFIQVIDTILHDTCDNQVSIETYPEINISFTQLQLTCTNSDNDNGNNAVVKASATGQYDPDEYHYFWQVPPLHIAPNDSTLAIGLKAYQKYFIKVSDNHGCIAKDFFETKGYPNPQIKIIADPDTAYIERPHITFSFQNLSEDLNVTNFFWNFGDETETNSEINPTHTYTDTTAKEYIVELTVYNDQGCDTIFDKTVYIEPVQLNIPNVFTPNKDGKNEVFEITVNSGTKSFATGGFKSFEELDPNAKPLNTYFESTDLIVFNRYGNKVYESKNYNNDWDGGNLSDGTYFYILKCIGFHKEYVFKGSVMIFRGSNK